MSPGARLTEIRVQLSATYAHLDVLVGELDQPEAGAALELRADIGVCLRRVTALSTFVEKVAK